MLTRLCLCLHCFTIIIKFQTCDDRLDQPAQAADSADLHGSGAHVELSGWCGVTQTVGQADQIW